MFSISSTSAIFENFTVKTVIGERAVIEPGSFINQDHSLMDRVSSSF